MKTQSFCGLALMLFALTCLPGCAITPQPKPFQGSEASKLAEIRPDGLALIELKSGNFEVVFWPVLKSGECYCDADSCIREDAIDNFRISYMNDDFSIASVPVFAGVMAICAIDGGWGKYGYCPPYSDSNLDSDGSKTNAKTVEPLDASYCPADQEFFTLPTDTP